MTHILQKGANTNLSTIALKLDDLSVTVEWFFPDNDISQADIDVSAFLLTEEGKVRSDRDIIFYNKPSTRGNTVVLLERALPNRQRFRVNLDKIPKAIQKIVFSLSLYEPEKTQIQLNQLKTLRIKVSNGQNTIDYISYQLEQCDDETALILLEIYRHQGDWKVKAINQGFINGLAALAQHYGVKIKEKPAPKPKKGKDVVLYDADKFVVFDLETTGFDAYRNEIIEIGALKYCFGSYSELQLLVKPSGNIPASITKLTGITQYMVNDKGVPLLQGLLQFKEFIEDFTLVAYNASFDRRFISAACNNHDIEFSNSYQCALQMARKAWPHLDNHKLITVVQGLQLSDSQEHRSLADCYLTASVYLKAIKILTSV